MKKFILIFSFFITVSASASSVEIYNFTAYNLNYQFNTVDATSHTYPILWSTNTLLTLTPATGFTDYSNSGGFPFNPTGGSNSPAIVSWVRQTSSTNPQIGTSNAVAQSVFGSSQVFGFLKYYFTGIVFAGNCGPYGDANYQEYNFGQVSIEYIDAGGGNVIYIAQ